MKFFWALIAVMAVVTAAVVFSGGRGTPAAPTLVATPSPQAAQAPADGGGVSTQRQTPQTDLGVPPKNTSPQTSKPSVEVTQPPTAEIKSQPRASEFASPVQQPAATHATGSEAPKSTEVADAKPSEPVKPPETDENVLLKIKKEVEDQRAAEKARIEAAKKSTPPAPTVADKPADPAAAQSPTNPEVPATAEASAGSKWGSAKVETAADGSLLIDGKFKVTGKGTEAEPYKVTWDHLVSAQSDYAPKEGKKALPGRVMGLNDSWVTITGYVAFPLMTQETDELLCMMNQWDGCCIGIPPTPYDAIEVRLTSAVSGNARLTTYGTITGRMKVDPHLVGGWLVGLYVMDSAKMTPVQYGGVAP